MRKKKRLELVSKDEGKAILVSSGEMTLNMLIDKFIVAKVSKQVDSKGTEGLLRFWREALGDSILDEITFEDIEKPLHNAMKERNWKASTFNNYRGPLLQCFKWGMSREGNRIIKHNPVNDVECEKADAGRDIILNDEQRKRLFFELAIRTSQIKEFTQDYRGKEVKCVNPYYKTASKDLSDLVHFGITTGCRLGEAGGLNWEDIDRKRSTINFTKAKRKSQNTKAEIVEGKLVTEYETNVITEGLKNGSSLKVIKMQSTLKKRLAQRELASKSELIFPNKCTRSWNSLLEVLRTPDKEGRFDGVIIPKGFCFHSLRHCCGSYLVQGGWSLEKTGEYLGQKSIQSTKRYSHFDETNSEEGAGILEERMFKS
tara:strand:- start:410 stop:1522 length:1113 start_codon:yes stop_codon:yes gene_type:complete